MENDRQCWVNVDSILNTWDEESPYGYKYGYWERNFTSKEVFETIANEPILDASYFAQQFDLYQDYKTTNNQAMAELLHKYDQYNPSPGRNGACHDLWDCRGMAYDLGSLALSAAGDALVLCTPVSGGLCGAGAVVVKGADYALTFESARYAGAQYARGNSSDLDMAIALAATAVSLKPGAGEGAAIVSLFWGMVDPFVPDESWGSARTAR